MWNQVQELNEAIASLNAQTPKLGGFPWLYVGDVDIRHGGTAVRVNRDFTYADVVESTDLGSATGQDGVALIEATSVPLGGSLSDRRRLRSAMETCGITMADLARDYQGDDRWQRWAELARALHIYGYRDDTRHEIIAHDSDALDRDEVRGGGFEIEGRVEGQAGLEESFMGYLD